MDPSLLPMQTSTNQNAAMNLSAQHPNNLSLKNGLKLYNLTSLANKLQAPYIKQQLLNQQKDSLQSRNVLEPAREKISFVSAEKEKYQIEKQKLQNIIHKDQRYDPELNNIGLAQYSRLNSRNKQELNDYFLRETDTAELRTENEVHELQDQRQKINNILYPAKPHTKQLKSQIK